ncbi:hypothetical protein GQ457_11G001760 [Hibiscus cannabinus]
MHLFDHGCYANASESGNCATDRDRGCSYIRGKVALVLPLDVLISVCGHCVPDGDRGCNANLPNTGNGRSDKGCGCYVNRWMGKDSKLWSFGLGSTYNIMATICGHNPMLELELLESTLAHNSPQGGMRSRDGLSHTTGLRSNMIEWDQGCKGKLIGSGCCGPAPTILTWINLPKPDVIVLLRKMVGCWAVIELRMLSLMTRPKLSKLCIIDFADYGTLLAALTRLVESLLLCWDGVKASLNGGSPLDVSKKHASRCIVANLVTPWCNKVTKGRLILSRNYLNNGNKSPGCGKQFCMVAARLANKGSNWDSVGRLNIAINEKMWCTVGFNRINSCSASYVRGCSGKLAETGICKPSHGNWLGPGLPRWEIITPFKGEEGCRAFIVKSLLSLLRVPQVTRETTYLKTLMETSNSDQFRNCGLACSILMDSVMPKRALTDFLFKIVDCLTFNGLCILSRNGRSLGNRAKCPPWISLSLRNICDGKRDISIFLLLYLSFWVLYSSWIFGSKETPLINQGNTCLAAFFVDCPTLMADPTNELAKKIEGLHFTEEELQGVAEIYELDNEPIEWEEKWVVGKLVSPRIVDGPQLIIVYFSVWKKQPLEDAASLGPNMFLFKFRKVEDKDFVLGRCPWTFDGELLALKPFDRLLTPKEYNFHPLPIWIRIYDVPLGYMNSKAGETIGNKIESHIATDLRDEMGCAGEYLRLRIEINSSKPLKRCTVLGRLMKSGQPRVCMIKYERLPWFCFYCGIIGHEHQLCPEKPEGNSPPFQYGDWLRVEASNTIVVSKRKSRPGIVYAPKCESDGNVKGLNDKDNGAINENAVDGGTMVEHKRGTKEEASKAKEDGLDVISDQLGPLTTPKAKAKNAKRSFKEKGDGTNLKKLKKDKLGPCPTSNVLVNRMKWLMVGCIVENQSVFVPGRLISDNVIIANELFHYLNGSKNGPNKGAAIKLDMEKAYDRVEWHFLPDIMSKMGFADKWIDSIMRCVTTVSFYLKINGEISESFRPSRGLRQGDPLSPYLFLLCTQGLSALLIKEQREGRIRGVRASQKGPRINHLLYADDCLLFIKNSEKEARRLKEVLTIYEASSGQKINVDKSSIYFSNGMCEQSKTDIKLILNMREDVVLGQYLELPLIVGKSKMEAFKFLIENVEKRSCNWSKNLLSYGGREIFIKSVAQGILAYAMCCFLLLDCILDPMVTTIRNFWWSGRHKERGWSHVAWHNLCKPMVAGGLGFRDLKKFNLALLAKQVWRLLCNKESLCFKVLSAKYFPQGDVLLAKQGDKASYVWNNIFKAKESFKDGFHWRLGVNSDVRMFKDKMHHKANLLTLCDWLRIVQGP